MLTVMVVKFMTSVMLPQGLLNGSGLLRSLNLEMRLEHLRHMHQLGHIVFQ